MNRRDYPGAIAFTSEEYSSLSAIVKESESDAAAAHAKLESFMRERAREVYDFLVRFVQDSGIPKAERAENKGGIVLVGWSFATVWMAAFLAHAPAFSSGGGDADLPKYLRRVILFGEPTPCIHSADTRVTHLPSSHAHPQTAPTSSSASRPHQTPTARSSTPPSPQQNARASSRPG